MTGLRRGGRMSWGIYLLVELTASSFHTATVGSYIRRLHVSVGEEEYSIVVGGCLFCYSTVLTFMFQCVAAVVRIFFLSR